MRVKLNKDGYKFSYPIVKGKVREDNESLNASQLIGSAFPIGGKYFLTAGHVLSNIKKSDALTLGVVKENQEWIGVYFTEYEILENFDLAILKVEVQIEEVFPWQCDICSNLTDVVVSGYPHGLDVNDVAIYRRDFKGYIITHRPFSKLKGKPIIYELSIACPKGISGSYILNEKDLTVCGIVIGNTKTEFDISYTTENMIEREGNIIYHKTETSSYGIGISSKSILNCRFNILNNITLEEHLKTHNLM